jgi:hypothetical protein
MRGFLSTDLVLKALVVLVLAHAAYLAVVHAGQPPLDVHAFRQSQTALTAYWFMQDGFSLAYETPVGGPPWSLPFEFPLYQAIVAGVAMVTGLPLDVVGRLTSFAFLVGCLFPLRALVRRLALPDSVFLFLVALVFGSPLYVYWGRAFMIETAALFFTLSAVRYFADYLLDTRPYRALGLFCLCATLAVLQKSTTVLPVLGVLGLVLAGSLGVQRRGLAALLRDREVLIAGASFAVVLAIGFAWVAFTDVVKSANAMGTQLTSAALTVWNLGPLAQRFSDELWGTVIWSRVLETNLAGGLGLFLLVLPLAAATEMRVRIIAGIGLVLGFLPLFLFSNLHVVHDYYQVANVVFLLFVVAVALGAVVQARLGDWAAVLLLVVVLGANFLAFRSGYLPAMANPVTKTNRDLAMGDVLRREVPAGGQFVAFGVDWNPAFTYMSGRKSFTVPGWLKDYADVAARPEAHVEPDKLGAVVACGDARPSAGDLLSWAETGRTWKLGEFYGCRVATPARAVAAATAEAVSCKGWLDRAEIEARDGRQALVLAGWLATSGAEAPIGPAVAVRLTGADGTSLFVDTLRIPRPDVNKVMALPADKDVGFSRLMSVALAPGSYEASVGVVVGDVFRSCPFTKTIVVP